MRESSVRVEDDSVEVALVRWPDDAVTRTLLAEARRPRLLVVSADATAPPAVDDLEDWVRDPVDPAELLARSDALRRRVAARAAVPRLDDHGLLHHDGRWVAVSDAQLPLMRLLVARFGSLVRADELVSTYVDAGFTHNPSSIRTAIMRIRARVRPLGLVVRSVRERGVILDRGP
jgi:DNA-binding response OmpR family regulator